jgi:preprotein translocase subunit SecG
VDPGGASAERETRPAMILAAYYHTLCAFLFTTIAIVLMLLILLQRGKGVGLAGAFGGAGGTTAFGAKTGDMLTWATIVGTAVLLTLTVVLNFVFVESGPGLGAPPPAAPTTPGAPTQMPNPAPTQMPAGFPGLTPGASPAPGALPTPMPTAPPTQTPRATPAQAPSATPTQAPAAAPAQAPATPPVQKPEAPPTPAPAGG